MPGAVIIGAGPGVGRSVALRFAREGMPIALISRTEKTVRDVARDLAPLDVQVSCLTADSADEAALRAALDAATAELGLPDVLVYNAAIIRADALGDLPASGQLQTWAVNVVGALTAAARLLPAMAQRGHGTFIATGGMPDPDPQHISLSLGKVGIRALVTMLDEQYRSSGVHVATVTIAGPVAPGTNFDPDDIAEQYWRLHTQPRPQWQTEIVHTG